MSFRTFLFVLALAMTVQAAVFSRHYTDLLYLRGPVDLLAQSGANEFKQQAESALGRGQLTRRHLETIAETARRTNQPDLEVRALERLAGQYPADRTITLRLADAWRRAGRLAEAEAAYQRLLGTNAAASTARESGVVEHERGADPASAGLPASSRIRLKADPHGKTQGEMSR
jgi:hypothetical protein